jgi:hypothetical protein
MRWILGLLVVISAGAGAFMYMRPQIGPVLSVCSHNAEIPQGERAEIIEAAERFMTLVRAEDAEAVRAAMSREAQQSTELEVLELAVQGQRGAGELSLTDIYKVDTPVGSRNGVSICGDASAPATISRHGGAHIAVTTIQQPLTGAMRTWTLYFEREDEAWRVRHVHFGVSGLAGRDGRVMRDLARAQANANHAFNATILYDTAAMLLERGDSFKPAEAYGLEDEREALRRHPDLPGNAPYTFHLGDASFDIRDLTIVGTSDQGFVLFLNQAGSPAADVSAAAARNRALIDAMNAHRPEWRNVFDAIAANTPVGETAVWRTVYSREQRYLPDPEPGGAGSD